MLSGLQDIGLIEHIEDALRGKRSVFRMAEPIVRLHRLITARYEPELVAGRSARVWERTMDTVTAKIYGPHFEDLARRWCMDYASEEALGGVSSHVRPTQTPRSSKPSRAPARPDVELVDLDRLYHGS